jgi:putative oxidoreductase
VSQPTRVRSRRYWARLGIWVLRILLAFIFLYEGLGKFSSSRLWATVFSRIGFGEWFRYATGAIEAVGALLLLIPRATTIAVTLLMCTMVGAIVTHVFVMGLGPQTIIVTVLIGMLLSVGWSGRA